MIAQKVQVIKCNCGKSIRIPGDWNYIHCRSCKTFWKQDSAGKWHSKSLLQQRLDKKKRMEQSQLEKEYLTCGCGNNIVITNRTTERKCFGCNHYWNKVDGQWIKSEHIVTKETNTLGDKMPDELKQILGIKQ